MTARERAQLSPLAVKAEKADFATTRPSAVPRGTAPFFLHRLYDGICMPQSMAARA